MTRFIEEHDTPCPIRLGRMGYVRTGDFRVPEPGELFIEPTDSPELLEHEPVVLGACGKVDGPRHIVRALEEGEEPPQPLGLFDLFAALIGVEDEDGNVRSLGELLAEEEQA